MKMFFLSIFWGIVVILIIQFLFAAFGGDCNGWNCGWFCGCAFCLINNAMDGKYDKKKVKSK